ncbi:hypothetical protein TPHA_0A00640 [Tetrapisispora phaffii CBS 4417]|uniref:Uncharacterized protein n=1 Tax=Tetrapisispora phaffii (strain ATCC 24235 / CBS 4417 / NBRC 1672 / NRRL Y-8282 / UCD 70-5) TaxID=1071381 RepID=G8BMM1_TETPH|nr:hypothetical protein TPHA_0A00640 [Tetrapisispora phaffii CBS 4417]CCE61149.1 hypothetical protein TPHA_0A00640 [Tetrapisispora phaffii CBS 4417]
MVNINTVHRGEEQSSKLSRRRFSVSKNGTVLLESTEIVETYSKKLYSFHELPEWQKDNELIIQGYVRETNSWFKCFHSLSYFHNESINIYTHLIPGLVYFIMLLFYTDLLVVPSFPSTTIMDYIVIDFYLLGAFICLVGSSCFHCLKQHSEDQSNFWSKIDYVGIICLISCSLISLLYYGYFDHFIYFKVFTLITLILATICTVCVLDERFNAKNFRPIRAGFFVVFATSAVIPICTGLIKFDYVEVINRIQLRFVGWETFFYVVGALLYGYRIPEIFAPGRFDLVGSSHQIFHVMVVIGSLFHLKAVIGSYEFMHKSLNVIETAIQ